MGLPTAAKAGTLGIHFPEGGAGAGAGAGAGGGGAGGRGVKFISLSG